MSGALAERVSPLSPVLLETMPLFPYSLRRRLTARLLIFVFLLSVRASQAQALRSASPGDEHWQTGFSLPGPDTQVEAVVVAPNGTVYAGGGFRVSGTVTTHRVARWDGSEWRAVGTGFEFGARQPVTSLAVGPNGDLYAAFYNTDPGGIAGYSFVARWDGTAWTGLGSPSAPWPGGADETIWDIDVAPNGDVYAVGEFTSFDGVPANHVARWDGTRWHALGTGISSGDDDLKVVIAPTGEVYVGGSFRSAGGVAVGGLARWDGTAWSAVGTGLSSSSGFVRDLAILPSGGLVVSGNIYFSPPQPVACVAQWNGATWQPIPTDSTLGHPDLGGAITVTPNGDVFAKLIRIYYPVTSDTASLMRWDGTRWHLVHNNNYAARLAASPTGDVYLGGGFKEMVGAPANGVARWSNGSFSALGTGLNDIVRQVSVSASGDVYAVGDFIQAGGVAARGVTRWDGTTWSALGTGIAGGARTVAAGPGSAVYVGGYFTAAGGRPARNVARWDGTAWHPMGAGLGWGSTRPEVTALAVAPNGALYAGFDTRAYGGNGCGFARWDTTHWNMLDTLGWGNINAIAFAPNGDVYVGGVLGLANRTILNVARWDGTQWHALGTGVGAIGSNMSTLVVAPNGDLYVGGGFRQVNGQLISYIARWDGTTWYPLAVSPPGPVKSLALASTGELYAGGFMPGNIARWDGTRWTGLGSGLGYDRASSFEQLHVSTVAMLPNGDVVAGGRFGVVGDGSVVTGYFARYSQVPLGVAAAVAVAPLGICPNPAQTRVQISSASAARATLCDMLGRPLRSVALVRGEGAVELAGLPAGVYLVRAGQQVKRLVVE